MKKLFLFILVSGLMSFGANAQTSTDILKVHDTSTVNEALNTLSTGFRVDYKLSATLGVPNPGGVNSNTVSLVNSSGLKQQLNLNRGGIYYRISNLSSTAWDAWRQVLVETQYGDFRIGDWESAPLLGLGKKLQFYGVDWNTDYLWIARYNVSSDLTDLRVNIGDTGNQNDRFMIGYTSSNTFYPHFVVSNYGRVGINVENPQNALDVNGTIRAKEVKVETGWADFVFAEDYKLPTIAEVQNHIAENKHLPGIPTEAEVKENGVNLGEMQAKLLQKIEELTLYVIQQQETIDKLNDKVEKMENEKK